MSNMYFQFSRGILRYLPRVCSSLYCNISWLRNQNPIFSVINITICFPSHSFFTFNDISVLIPKLLSVTHKMFTLRHSFIHFFLYSQICNLEILVTIKIRTLRQIMEHIIIIQLSECYD